ncbi:MAG: triose-phosphate isomerase [Patescibacteria group bacterium]|jgi:triosephosphate isomerase
MQEPIIIANWKMQLGIAESQELAKQIASEATDVVGTVVLCPTFAALSVVAEVEAINSQILLGAQDCYFETKGTFTSATSPAVLAELGCKYVIVGHSDRRYLFGDTNDVIQKKMRAVALNGMTPVLCVGETAEERKQGQSEDVVMEQLKTALADFPVDQPCIITYEPVWAISHGTPHVVIKEEVEPLRVLIAAYLRETNRVAPVIYGGSVVVDNVQSLVGPSAFAGALVGGASLTAKDFLGILANVRKLYAV